MAISRVQIKTYAASAAALTHTITLDAAPSSGNLLTLCVVGDATISQPGGWSTANSAVADTGTYIFYRVSDGTETSVQFTLSSSTTAVGVYSEYSGTDPTPFDKTASTASNTGSTISTGTTPTTTVADELLLAVVGISTVNSTVSASSWNNSFTEDYDAHATGGNAVGGAFASRIVSATGAYTTTATLSASATNASAIIATFEIRQPQTMPAGQGDVAGAHEDSEAYGPIRFQPQTAFQTTAFQSNAFQIAAGSAGGESNPYSRGQSDPASGSEVEGTRQGAAASQADAVASGESSSSGLGYVRAQADAAAGAEAVRSFQGYAASESDAAAAAESCAATLLQAGGAASVGEADGAAGSDPSGSGQGAFGAESDAGGAGEANSSARGTPNGEADAAAATDIGRGFQGFASSEADAAAAADACAGQLLTGGSKFGGQTDGGAGGESEAARSGWASSAADAAASTDPSAARTGAGAGQEDVAAAGDDSGASLWVWAGQTDAGAAGDDVAWSEGLPPGLGEEQLVILRGGRRIVLHRVRAVAVQTTDEIRVRDLRSLTISRPSRAIRFRR